MENFLLILITFILLIALTRVISVAIHEMGHALAGLILLKGNISIYIGSHGDPKKGFHFGIGRLKVHFKYNPLLWSHGLCVSNATQITLLRNYLFTLAGPLASLITTFICLFLLVDPNPHGVIKIIAIFLFFSSLLDFFQNIRPNEDPIFLHDGSMTYNDGQTLKLLKSYKGVCKELIKLNEYHSNNNTKEGIKFFEETYAKKKDINLLRMGATMYIKDENFEKAFELFSQLQTITELTADDYCNYALAYSYSEEHSKALELYNKSLKMNPDNFYSLNNRGYTFNLIGQYESAMKDFDKAIELNPKFAHAYNNRGLSKIKMGNEKEGLGDIEKSMQLDGNNSYAYKNLGIYHMEKGELQRAIEFFHKAREIDPKTHGLFDLIEDTENQMQADKNRYKA
ncbi:M50 family metallopeptidase [Fulvivirgaceae bacterium BMA12]|uniref:M50 family metallopeptidase n=1 Tax=Agaribacillus aureus TaxID=3051825 RepID=A0ABT8L9U9_9BACT|nr:M50 family metallopeptidase [Fulvivirgaceae bacterium BMA12]